MNQLERFIRFWAGTRKPEYGESADKLASLSLPPPLKQLMVFAGKWPALVQPAGEDELLHIQDHLLHPSDIKLNDDGRLEFLEENSGEWTCVTLPEGEDPPVWHEDVYKVYGKDRWVKISDSLSSVLITFTLNELLVGSPCCRSSADLEEFFKRVRSDAMPLWTNGPYAYCENKAEFYMIDSAVLVGRLSGHLSFAAVSDKGVQLIEREQGKDVKRLEY